MGLRGYGLGVKESLGLQVSGLGLAGIDMEYVLECYGPSVPVQPTDPPKRFRA